MEKKRIQIYDAVISRKGGNHADGCAQNEDVIQKKGYGGTMIYGLADGQSGRKYCVKGGEEILKAVMRYVGKNPVAFLTQRQYADEISYEIMKIIRETLDRLSEEYETDKNEFSSTLLLAALDLDTGEYMVIHLGDGCVVGLTKEDEIRMVSAPDNGITTKYTWVTASENALKHLRVGFGDLNNYKRLFILSDGMECICQGKRITQTGKKLIQEGKASEIQECMERREPRDDATCIMIELES